jgi:hypothetical protein
MVRLYKRGKVRKAAVTGLIIGILLVTLLVPKTGVEAAQYVHSPPWANRFTFTYPDGLDTTGCDENWETWTEYYAGYSAAYNRNVSVYATWVLSHDAVFSFVGHGYDQGGHLTLWNGSSNSDLRASTSMPPIYSVSLSLESLAHLQDLRLMSLVACKSAVVGPPTSGGLGNSLTGQGYLKGVDCSLGFQEHLLWINYPPPEEDVYPAVYWDNYFYWRLGVYGDTVEDAAEMATGYIFYYWGAMQTYFGLDSWLIYGDPSIKIKPAAYGS